MGVVIPILRIIRLYTSETISVEDLKDPLDSFSIEAYDRLFAEREGSEIVFGISKYILQIL